MTSKSRATADEHFVIGLDIGTSAVKGAVISSAGNSFSYTSAGYPTRTPAPGYAEQDPDDWWRAVGEVLDLILEAHPALDASNSRIGLTGQMHTTVARDEKGAVVRPAILWSDTRASDTVRRLAMESIDWIGLTGYNPIPAFTSAHLAWLREEEPVVFGKVHRVSVPKDDIRQRLGAGWATEPSDASAMNLMDTRTDRWAQPLLAAVGIEGSVLAPIVASDEVTGGVTELPPMGRHGNRLLGTPVVAGAGDQAAQALALGATTDQSIAVSVGTSGAAFQALRAPRAGAFRHAVPGTWLALDSTHAAGLALAWWSGIAQRPVDDISDVRTTSSDLPLFLPYLQGGRDGHGAPGTLTDLRSTHNAADIADAVVEGVGIELVRLVQAATLGHIPDQPIGVGGRAAQIEALRSVMAAGLARPIRYSGFGPSHGAALLAASAAEWSDALLRRIADETTLTLPDPVVAARLAPRMARYSHLIDQLS